MQKYGSCSAEKHCECTDAVRQGPETRTPERARHDQMIYGWRQIGLTAIACMNHRGLNASEYFFITQLQRQKKTNEKSSELHKPDFQQQHFAVYWWPYSHRISHAGINTPKMLTRMLHLWLKVLVHCSDQHPTVKNICNLVISSRFLHGTNSVIPLLQKISTICGPRAIKRRIRIQYPMVIVETSL